MNVREKLVEIMEDLGCNDEYCKDCEFYDDIDGCLHRRKEIIADRLIANGVTVQECGYWVSYELDEPYGCMDDKEWYRCSKCGKDARGRCYDDEWYSAPILSAYCPHCGAKMIPKPPKGE